MARGESRLDSIKEKTTVANGEYWKANSAAVVWLNKQVTGRVSRNEKEENVNVIVQAQVVGRTVESKVDPRGKPTVAFTDGVIVTHSRNTEVPLSDPNRHESNKMSRKARRE